MLLFAKSILKCISDNNPLKRNSKLMRIIFDKVIKSYFNNLECNLSDESLKSFFKLVDQFIITFCIKGNLIINSNANHKILLNALCSKNNQVQKGAKIIQDRLKNS